MDLHRDAEKVFEYVEAKPRHEGEFKRFAELYRYADNGELCLVLRARDLRVVSIELPADQALGLAHALNVNVDATPSALAHHEIAP